MVGGRWHIGRQAIIDYLKDKIDLPDDPKYAWQKVIRWKYRTWLPILRQPNGKPYIDEDEFASYWKDYLKKHEEKVMAKFEDPVKARGRL